MTLTVVDPGPLTLVQDGGRPGQAALGVSTSGAFDRAAMRQANALVGNPPDAPVLEVLLGGLRLRADVDHLVSVVGASGPLSIPYGRATLLTRDQTLQMGRFTLGLRGYVGVAGGFVVDPVLGSCARDTLADLGSAPLVADTRLEIGRPGTVPDLDDVPPLLAAHETTLDVVPGPRDEWFTPRALTRLLSAGWRVDGHSDRVGVRLDGPPLERVGSAELPSEPCVRGSIQVTAAGQPIVFGPDHPVTGGYPVIAVVVDAHTDRLAQVRPGDVVRFARRPR